MGYFILSNGETCLKNKVFEYLSNTYILSKFTLEII